MKVTDPGVQIYARQLGVSPAMALRRLQVQQIGRETKDYDSTMLPELSPYVTRMLGLHLAMDQADLRFWKPWRSGGGDRRHSVDEARRLVQHEMRRRLRILFPLAHPQEREGAVP